MSSLNEGVEFEGLDVYVDTFGAGLGFDSSLGSHQHKCPLENGGRV